MSRVVIAEFMDERAVAQLRARHDVLYDPALWTMRHGSRPRRRWPTR